MKRLFDVFISFLGLIFLFPLIVLIALLVRIYVGKSIFFLQTRPGLNGQPFEMVKFRTMKDAVDQDGNVLPDSQRMTSFGHKLRNTSLDELPELLNVIKGDMSLVGPRPLLIQYLPLYTKKQFRRHEVLPGITGWAQVNGRNSISWEEKFDLDVWYVDNQNFLLDLKILFLTFKKVFFREGISADGEVTMPVFKGKLKK